MSRTFLLKTVDSTIGPLLCKIFGLISYYAYTEASEYPPTNPQRILLIRPGGLGDMIILTPIIRILSEHFPDANIDLACEKRNMEAVELANLKVNIITYDNHPFGFIAHIVRTNYDVVIDTEQFHHASAIFSYLSGAHTRIGFKINPRRNPLYTHLINYEPGEPEGLQFMSLLRPLDINIPYPGLVNELSSIETESIPSEKISEKDYVVIHPGSSTPYKRWDRNKYLSLAQMIHKKFGLNIVLTGNANDKRTCAAIMSAANSTIPISLTGVMDLRSTAKVVRNAKLFIGTDSGLAHLAIALGVKTVILFGSSDPMKWGIEDKNHMVVTKHLQCSPCYIFGYHKPCKTINCMKKITTDEVFQACCKLLQLSA